MGIYIGFYMGTSTGIWGCLYGLLYGDLWAPIWASVWEPVWSSIWAPTRAAVGISTGFYRAAYKGIRGHLEGFLDGPLAGQGRAPPWVAGSERGAPRAGTTIGLQGARGAERTLPPRPQGQDLPMPLPLCWLCRNFIGRLEASIPKVPGGGWDPKEEGWGGWVPKPGW